jgi:hypothetical protein
LSQIYSRALPPGQVTARSAHYNDTPESRGIARHRGTYTSGGGTGRDREDAARLAAWLAAQGQAS